MSARPPAPPFRRNPFADLAAAATPVVAAALIGIAALAAACGDAMPRPTPSPAPAASVASPSAPASPDPAAGRLVLLLGAPRAARAAVIDLGTKDGTLRPEPMALPQPAGSDRLVAIAAAPGGRLAAVSAGGAVWVTPAPVPTDVETPDWTALAPASAPRLPGPVLGATWARDGTRVLLLSGSPGSGSRRMAVVGIAVDGSATTAVDVPLEADGPGIAALPRGQVAFVGRDLRDRGALARIAASGSFVTLPVSARSVASGGDLVILVDDTAVRAGSLADLDRGVLPVRPLPLEGDAGFGAVAVLGDGSRVAVVRLDAAGDAQRVDLLRRGGDDWEAAGTIPLDPDDGTALPAWLP